MSEEHKIKLLENYISEHKKMTDSMIEILQQENENLRSTIKTYDGIANNLCKKVENLKQQLKDKDEKISKIEKLTKQLKGSARYERCMDELDYILNIIKED